VNTELIQYHFFLRNRTAKSLSFQAKSYKGYEPKRKLSFQLDREVMVFT